MFLICGLGNPGKEYIGTRHNIGFALIDKLVSFYNFISYKKDSKKEIFKGVINNNSCFLLKPLNFMNLSGQPIREVMNFYKIEKIYEEQAKIADKFAKAVGFNGIHDTNTVIERKNAEHAWKFLVQNKLVDQIHLGRSVPVTALCLSCL